MQPIKTPREKAVELARKIHGLTKSSNENEAMVAMDALNQLMIRHDLSMSEVEVQDIKREGVVEEKYQVPNLKMKYHWVVTLAGACAKLFGGKALSYSSLHGTRVSFVAAPSDIANIKSLFEHLWGAWQAIIENDLLMAKIARADSFSPRDTMKFKLGHGQAYAYRIYKRVEQLIEERKAAKLPASGSTALVVIKEQMVEEALKKMGVKTKKVNQQSGDMVGREYGDRAGKNAALGGAITDGPKRLGASAKRLTHGG